MSIQQNSIYSFKSIFQKTTINWENAPNIMLNEKIFKIWYKSYSNFYFFSSAYFGFTFSSVHSLSCVWLFATPRIAAHQASLTIVNSRSLLKLMSIKLVMPYNCLIFCHPLLQPSIFPSIKVFSNESVLCIRWPKYWSISFCLSTSNEYSGLISFRIDWFDLLAV